MTLSHLLRAAGLCVIAFSPLAAASHAGAQRTSVRVHSLTITAHGPRRGAGQTWQVNYHVSPPPGARLTAQFERGGVQIMRVSNEPGMIRLGSLPSPGEVVVRATDSAGRPIPLIVGGITLASVSIHTTHVPQPSTPMRPPPGPSLTALANACDAAFNGERMEAQCVRTMRARPNAVAEIRACGEAFDGDRSEMACLETGAAPLHVRTCAELFDGDRRELECAGVLAQSRLPEARIRELANVCGRRNGDRAEMACLREHVR